MKVNKFTSALIGAGLAAAVGVASAAETDPPNTSKGEESAFALSESFLSLTAAVITRVGSCAAMAGSYDLGIVVDANGNGGGTFDNDIVYNILRMIDPQNALNGNQYDVSQAGEGLLRSVKTAGFNGHFGFGIQGAIMEGNSTYDLYEFGVANRWDETIIKDFWTVDVGFGKFLRDDGLEVITKLGYPRSKWRQVSDHERPDGNQGFWSATKTLVTINNVAACQIVLKGAFSSNFGGINFGGSVSVIPL